MRAKEDGCQILRDFCGELAACAATSWAQTCAAGRHVLQARDGRHLSQMSKSRRLQERPPMRVVSRLSYHPLPGPLPSPFCIRRSIF